MKTVTFRPRRSAIACAVALALTPLVWSGQALAATTGNAVAAPAAAAQVSFNIPAQALGSAVLAYAQQAGVQVFFESSKLAGLQSPGLKGRYGVREGLAALLGNNPVSYDFQNEQRVSLDRLPDQGEAMLLGPVDITANTDSDKVFQTPRSVSNINREQMNRHIVRHAADLLEETEGVYSAVSLRDPGLSVNIRGVQDYGRVNMNIDGMRQDYSQMGHQARNGTIYVDPELLGGIDITKGSSSGQGGAGVSGGIATFKTLEVADILKPDQEVGGRLRASHGIGSQANGQHFTGSTVFAVRSDVWDGLFGYSERHLGNYRAGDNHSSNLSDFIGAQYDNMYSAAGERWRTDEVKYMESVQRSYLGKLGLNLPDGQRVQLTHAETTIGYDDASWDVNNSNKTGTTVYKRNGDNDITSQSNGLDYSWKPDNDLIDLKAKAYYVTTRNFQENGATSLLPAYDSHTRTDTYGLQLENTSRFHYGRWGELAVNYGGEVYRDEFKPKTWGDVYGTGGASPYVDGVDPDGKRTMASLFNNLTWEYGDWLTVSGGLRYDHYWMKGTAGMTREGAAAAGEYGLATRTYIYDVDDSEGRFSPSFSVGVKPGLDWMQFYASYGRGWRPPTVTETFTSGRPHGGGTERIFPNPYLKPERSRDYELGVNIIRDSFLIDGDRLRAKVAYFNTRIDDFSFLDMTIESPGTTAATYGTKMAYVNNLKETRFRGIDYKLTYDTGRVYADLTYTHMIGSNEFCAHPSYLGGATKIDPTKVQATTSLVTIRPGLTVPVTTYKYGYVADTAQNNQVLCGGIFGNAAYMPPDRGALTLGSRWFNNTVDVGMRARYSKGASADRDEWNNNTLSQQIWPRYTVYDAYLSWWATPDINVGVQVENVTNEAYLVAMGDSGSLTNLTLARGRTVTGSLEYRF